MADGDGLVQVSEVPLCNFVQADAGPIIEPEQTVLGEDRSEPIDLRGRNANKLQRARALMTVEYVDLLPNEQLTECGVVVPHRQKADATTDDWQLRKIIHLDSVRQVEQADALALKCIGHHGDLVAHLNKALTQVELMHLDAADIGKLKV